MGNNTQSRKWTLVINHPQEAGLTHAVLEEILRKFSPEYYCMADEIASTGTYHTHIFLYAASPIRFSTVKNRFPTAHAEKAYGSVRENRDYITKSGKWANSEKSETVVPDTFLEWGTIPAEKEETSPAMFRLIQDLRNGKTVMEVVEDNPDLAFRIRDIELLRQTILTEKYQSENRNVEVSYLYGASGAGKTRSIFQTNDPKEICRITNYRLPSKNISFDGYSGQDVLVFEEFNSQIPIEDMLNYLDVYPLQLPARYSDRVACYTKVYITSNQPLDRQYRTEQLDRPETWRAFLRRIHHIVEFLPGGSTIQHK